MPILAVILKVSRDFWTPSVVLKKYKKIATKLMPRPLSSVYANLDYLDK